MAIKLYDYQIDAIDKLNNGSILCGGVGSGKSLTAIAYYFKEQGGDWNNGYLPMDDLNLKDLYIITTARKRDTCEWEGELSKFLISPDPDVGLYHNKVVIDSWNNIQKYAGIENAFFIFDEQRVVGKGVWVKAFLKITKKNDWILLSATPGDTWSDYIPVFIANGFYKNRSEFNSEHIKFAPYSKFPKVERYLNTGRLIRLRNKILVGMDYTRPTEVHHEFINCDYDILAYKRLIKERWNDSKNQPIINASELCYELRKVSNSHPSRIQKTKELIEEKHKVIIFYNFDYELDILKTLAEEMNYEYAEWNGHKHQPLPEGNNWIYLVQYNAGAEGWNCIKTDTIIFYSQNYSYKIMAQSSGRIDRLNTPYKDLYYYHLKSLSGIDAAIAKAIKSKKKFNEGHFASSFT